MIITIAYNHDTGLKLGNLNVHSSYLVQKRSARFQLELITRLHGGRSILLLFGQVGT